MTSVSAGHRHIRGRSERPHTGWRPPYCASSAAWIIPPHSAHCPARSSGTSARRTAQSARSATTWRAPGWPTPSWRAAASAWSRRPRPIWRTSWPTSCAAAAPARTPWHAGAAPPGRTGLRPGPATRPAPPANRQAIRRAALAAPRASPGSRCASPIPVAWSGGWRRLAGLVEAEMAHHWFIRLLRCLLRSRRRRLQPPAWGERSHTAVSGLACRACGRPPAGRTG
jgi:hypothetical protein